MKISYVITEKEAYKIALIRYFSTRENKSMSLMGVLIIICSIFSDKITYKMGALGTFILLGIPLIQLYWTRRALKSTPNPVEEVTMKITENNLEITEKDNENSSTLEWDSISKYRLTKNYIFISLNDLVSFAIPKRAFLNNELLDFIQLLKTKKD